MKTVAVPDLQYDTSDTELLGKVVGTVGDIAKIGTAGFTLYKTTQAIGEASRPMVVEQPAPVIVEPTIVEPFVVQ